MPPRPVELMPPSGHGVWRATTGVGVTLVGSGQRRHAYARLNECLKGAGSTIRRDAPDRRGQLGMELDR